MTVVSIACRFVPYDQWFVTHLDDAWRVRHAKHWLLSKSNLVHSPGPLSHRAVSPITFAPSIRSSDALDALDDGYSEDDEFSDHDLPRNPAPAPAPASRPVFPLPASSPLVDQYALLSFSTGALLEDDFPLAWYNLRPYELLEIHPVGTIARLHRDVLADYIQPYFQAKASVLRAVWNHRSGRFEPPAFREHARDSFSPSQSDKRRKTRVDWKARWLVISQGILSLSKGHVTNPPLCQFALASMSALRGADALERAFAIVAEPRVVCIKFRPRSASLPAVVSPPPSLPSSPVSESLRTHPQDPSDSAPDSKQSTEQEEKAAECAHDGEGVWIVLDMLDDHAFSSILRILHRQAPCPISSSFVPSSSIITVSHSSVPSPAVSSFASYDTIPYPEWRVNTVENARKAGMGDIGKPMAWVIWTDKGLGDTLMGNIRHHRQAFSREMQYKATDIYSASDDASDDESEMEWEGWMRDLERQGQVKQRSERAGRPAAPRPAHVPSSASPALPSPPPSETSPSGSPRVRPPSLTAPFGASLHAQYSNIENVIQAHGYRSTGYSLDKIKSTTVSTVSVGMTPFSRRRSSTLTTDTAPMRRDYDKGRRDREPFQSASTHGARANARTVSVSSGLPSSPRATVRQVHSSSNLRISSHGSDAAESPGPSSPSKRQSAFMRGMSLRAGKLVRGLESAIDFVDEKTL